MIDMIQLLNTTCMYVYNRFTMGFHNWTMA